MGDLISLNRARKARVRESEKDAAARNRARHGRTRAERETAAAQARTAARELDGKKRET